MSEILENFVRVSDSSPCPCCGRSDWCLLSNDGTQAICQRVESGKECGDAGFLHVVDDPVPPEVSERKPSVPSAVVRYKAEQWAREGRGRVSNLALRLGVSERSLHILGAGWDQDRRRYSFPMFDEDRNYIGVRFRSLDGLSKLSLRGGRNGLFFPGEIPHSDTWLLVEGPTDCAAALDLGYWAIGRPDNCGGAKFLNALLNRHSPQAVVVADNDDAGWYGARRLARKLNRRAWIIAPRTAKDIRDYYNAGGSRSALSRALCGQENKHWIVEKKT